MDATVKCPFCQEEIMATAIKCKHCRSMLVPVQEAEEIPKNESNAIPITSMVLGILAVLAASGNSEWNDDNVLGLAMLSIPALVLGIICVAKQKRGKGMAISGIVLGSIGLLIALGQT